MLGSLLVGTLLGSILTSLALMFMGVMSPTNSNVVPGPLPSIFAAPNLRKSVPVLYAPNRLPLRGSTSTMVTRVNAHMLLRGNGEAPILDATVIFDASNNSILYAGPSRSAPALAANATFSVATVMPGLWDCHTHYLGHISDKFAFHANGMFGGEFPVNYMRFNEAVQMLRETLMMGITSVREVGGAYGQPLHALLQSGAIVGPNFHYAGRCVGMTGGHTDDQLLPLDEYSRMDAMREVGGALCDGVPECLKRIRENLRMQSDVIKIMTSGGVLTEFDQARDPQLSPEEILAITQDAKRARRAVAAHAHATEGIQNAIDNGVTSIEHGTFMTRDQAKQIKDRGYMVYTPTATVTQELFNGTKPAELDDNQWRKGQDALLHHRSAIQMAIEEGATIVTGTDCPQSCAEVGKEINYLHMFGMTPQAAIKAATGDAPKCMGQWGLMPKSGLLIAGYEADVIAVNGNPLDDLKLLTQSEKITHVWKAGNVFKAPEEKLTPPVSDRRGDI